MYRDSEMPGIVFSVRYEAMLHKWLHNVILYAFKPAVLVISEHERYEFSPGTMIFRWLSLSIAAMLAGLIGFGGCTDLSDFDRDSVEDAISDSVLSVTESRNIRMELIEDGHRKVTVVSPYAATYERDGTTETELKEQVDVTVRDTTGAIETTVSSKSARYIGNRSEFHFQYDVVVETGDGRRLFTEYLEWSQQDRTVHTPEFVIIVTPTDSITGYGLDGTDDLTTYTLSEVAGEFELDEEEP